MNQDVDLLNELKCPNCSNYMQAPIRLCATGHSFCDPCSEILKSCPICQHALPGNRNYALEKLAEKCHFPCRNRERGCQMIEIGAAIRQHEKVCPFKDVKCPLADEENCQWTGTALDALQHCLTRHPDETFTTVPIEFKFDNFVTRKYHSVFGCMFCLNGQMFKFVYDNDVETGKTQWCVLLIPTQPDDYPPRYDFEIKFINEHCKRQTLSLRGPCPVVSLDDEKVRVKKLGPSFMLTNFSYLKDFCKTPDLFYNLRIFKRDDGD